MIVDRKCIFEGECERDEIIFLLKCSTYSCIT